MHTLVASLTALGILLLALLTFAPFVYLIRKLSVIEHELDEVRQGFARTRVDLQNIKIRIDGWRSTLTRVERNLLAAQGALAARRARPRLAARAPEQH